MIREDRTGWVKQPGLTLDGRDIWYDQNGAMVIRDHQPTGDAPGLDTPERGPQTSSMRSTTDDDDQVCDHDHVEADDDGLSSRFHVCLDCDRQVVLSEPDEDGQSYWEVIE